ncbi:hypothetical protein PO909_004219 [Leuciscus waleckii]
MRSVALLLIGIHLVYAGMDSHIDIYTASKGVAGLSVFVAASMVNRTQVDSEIKVIPMQAVDEQFQQNNTQNPPTMHQTFKDNKNIAMERFNQAEVPDSFFALSIVFDDNSSLTLLVPAIDMTDSPRASQPSKPVGIQQKSVPLEEAFLEEALLEEASRNLRGQQKSVPQKEALLKEVLRESLLCSPSRSSSTTRRRPAQ